MSISRYLLCLPVLVVLAIPDTASAAAGLETIQAVLPEKHVAFLDKYCLECHDSLTEKGGIDLEELSFDLGTMESAEMWQKVLNTLNSGEMPPEDKPQPAFEEKAGLLDDLSSQLVVARKLLSDTGGALFLSSDQIEQYLALARMALDAAIVSGLKPETRTVRIEAEDEANRRIRGIFRGYQKNGFVAWKRWQASKGKPPSDFGFVDEAEINFRKLVWDRESPDYADYLAREETQTGAFLTISNPNPQVGLAIPDEAPVGRYRVRAKIGVNRAAKPDPSDTLVINDLLADYYGIEGVRGPKFREVPVPAGMPRGGLPGMAAILAMGSDGERSSPVERGVWVLRYLLNDPPPPAPPNVPQLSRHAGKLLPARELLEMHMEEAQCAQCHRKIDPIGYGLEHFNAVGLWRDLA